MVEEPAFPGTSGVGILGPSRPDLAFIARAVAESLDPEFDWVQVAHPGAAPASRELEVLEEIGLDRILRLDPSDVGPHGLPPALLGQLGYPGARATPRVVVLANIDLALDRSPHPEGLLARVLRELGRTGLLPILTFGGTRDAYRTPFQCVIMVGASPSPSEWDPLVDWSGSLDALPSAPSPSSGPETSRQLARRLRAASSAGRAG